MNDNKEALIIIGNDGISEKESLFNLTKAQIAAKGSELAELVINGHVSQIEALVGIRKQQELLKAAEEQIKAIGTQHLEKGYEIYNCKVEVADNGGKYNYAVCEDEVWKRLSEAFEVAKSALDERQEFLKKCKTGMPLIDEQTGESYQLSSAPLKVGGVTGYKLTLK